MSRSVVRAQMRAIGQVVHPLAWHSIGRGKSLRIPLEQTSTGKPLGLRSGWCHHPLRGPSAFPVVSAQLKRWPSLLTMSLLAVDLWTHGGYTYSVFIRDDSGRYQIEAKRRQGRGRHEYFPDAERQHYEFDSCPACEAFLEDLHSSWGMPSSVLAGLIADLRSGETFQARRNHP